MHGNTIRDSLGDDDRAKFEHGAELLAKLQEGRAFDDWIVIGQGLMPVREAILKLYRLRKPRGRLYVETFSKACAQTAYTHLDSDERSNLLYCVDNLAAIEKMRADWSPSERASICHPDSMRKRLRAYLAQPEKKPKRNAHPMVLLKEANMALHDEVVRLKDVVKNGSNLSAKDTYGDLARTLCIIITESGIKEAKALKMVKRLDELLREHYRKEKAEWSESKAAMGAMDDGRHIRQGRSQGCA